MSDRRKPIFDALRTALGGSLSADQVTAMSACLDALKVPDGASDGAVDAFSSALQVILRHEGGFVDHPKDPGGMTNLGVTKATWEAWTGKAATEMDMRALTPATVAPLYRKNYWEKIQCDKLPPGLALCVFDFAVNAGPARAARYLQAMVGTDRDGVVGDNTLAAVAKFVASVGEAEAVRRYQESRRTYYKQLRTYPVFGRGWLRRVNETEQEALEMAT